MKAKVLPVVSCPTNRVKNILPRILSYGKDRSSVLVGPGVSATTMDSAWA